MAVTIMISAGSGPQECVYAAKHIARAYAREAKADGIEVLWLDSNQDGSFLLRLKGEDVERFLEGRLGTVQWKGQSPFRKNHKRKNWFVGAYALPEPEAMPELSVRDIRFTACRAGGPGGQHVNKTNSAVRAVHGPTGLTVTAREERSQHANKKLCLLKLAAIMAGAQDAQQASSRKSVWQSHKALKRGNPVRIYKGPDFRS